MLNKWIPIVAAGVVAGLTVFPSGAQAGEKLRVAYAPLSGHAKVMVAKEQGFFEKEGLDAELVELANSALLLDAVKAGTVDVAACSVAAPLVAISKGVDVRIIGGIFGEGSALLTTAKNAGTIKGISDLKGKKVGTVVASTPHAVLLGALSDAHLNWKTDLQVILLKTPRAVLEAMKNGEIDAGMVWNPFDLEGTEKYGFKVVINSASIYPGHPCCRAVILGERQKEKATWEKFLRALLRAEKFETQDHEKTLDTLVKYVKLDRATIDRSFYHTHVEQRTDPNLHGVQKFWKIMQDSGFIEAKFAIDPYVDLNLYRAALEGLAKEEPKDPFWSFLKTEFERRNL